MMTFISVALGLHLHPLATPMMASAKKRKIKNTGKTVVYHACTQAAIKITNCQFNSKAR